MIQLWSSVRRLRACTRSRLALVVDSDNAFRTFAMRGLLRAGCTSVGFTSADEALLFVEEASEAPVLVLLDARLEHGDGVELCAAIRSNPRVASVPILCASSFVELDDRLRALRAGVDVFLPKPVAPDLFIDAAARLLRGGGRAQHAGRTFIHARRM